MFFGKYRKEPYKKPRNYGWIYMIMGGVELLAFLFLVQMFVTNFYMVTFRHVQQQLVVDSREQLRTSFIEFEDYVIRRDIRKLVIIDENLHESERMLRKLLDGFDTGLRS